MMFGVEKKREKKYLLFKEGMEKSIRENIGIFRIICQLVSLRLKKGTKGIEKQEKVQWCVEGEIDGVEMNN